MRKSLIVVALGLLALTGCATGDYKLYAESQAKIAQAHTQAEAMKEAARYAALAEIAKSGDSATRVAAVMSINMGGMTTRQGNQVQQVAAPKPWTDQLLQWTSVLLPSMTQLYGIQSNRQIAITQSNNQAAVAQSTNNTFAAMNAAGHNANVSIANKGFDTVGAVAGAGLTAVTTIGTNGLNTATNISKDGNATVVDVTNATNTSLQNLTNTIPRLQPNITTTTTNN